MKKLYYAFLALFLLASFPGLAQKGFYFGFAVTGQSTWITNQNNYGLKEMDLKSTFGIGYNVNIGFDFTNHIGLKTEIGMARYGQKYTDSRDSSQYDTGGEFDRDVQLNYLTIPIMFKYRLGGPIAKFYVAVGPQFNMLMSAKQTYSRNGKPFLVEINDTLSGKTFLAGKEEIKERFAGSDIMARVDLGMDITVVKHLIIEIGVKLQYGLMDLNSADFRLKDNSGNYAASHNIAGGLTIGVNYHL